MPHVVKMGKAGGFLLIYLKLIIYVQRLKGGQILMRICNCYVLLVIGEKATGQCNICWIFRVKNQWVFDPGGVLKQRGETCQRVRGARLWNARLRH